MFAPPSKTCERVYEVVSEIPVGKVATYGDIAKLAGVTNPRVVGNCLHRNPYPTSVPCHRVVNAAGRLAPAFAFGGAEKQRERLASEQVAFNKGRVDLKVSRWTKPSGQTYDESI
jgi:O-6-methylguanine DNA methyltransferase